MQPPKRIKKEILKPILSDDITKKIPLIDVYVGKIKSPKTTSRIVVQLNSVLPVPDLMHLKRVRGNEIILCTKSTIEECKLLDFLKDKGFDSDLIESIRVTSVAKVPPKVRQQYEVVHKLWPCNFHSNDYLEKLSTNTLFSNDELEQHILFMEMALDISKTLRTKESTLIVDPVMNSIVAFGFDQTEEYPTKHSIMVAIDEVARSQKGAIWKQHHSYEKLETMLKEKYDVTFGSNGNDDGPYLCTGYSVYTVCEPCITCAMALIHSRAKRVFYGTNSVKGALNTLCKIHLVENLNHHYEVFSGLLETECRHLLC